MKNSGILLALIVTSIFTLSTRAGDAGTLATILVPDEDWQAVVTGLGFADGLSYDVATGNIFFSDMKPKEPEKPGIYTLSPTLEKKRLFDGKFSGTRAGADGKTLYAIGSGKIVSFALPNGPETLVAEKVGTNDLVVTREGRVYFTGNGKMQVSLADAKTQAVSAADVGHVKSPNGIGLSPDQKMLLVSDYGGVNVWTFAIQPDGTLADRKPAMTMKCPEKQPDVSKGDGMAIDADGRAYVTTALGLQIFAPGGERLGVVPKPKNDGLRSCTFGGTDLNYLYVACGDTIYRRKVQVKGVSFK